MFVFFQISNVDVFTDITDSSTEGNLHFKIEWASLIFGSKFTVLALFYFVFEGNFPSKAPRGAYILRGLFLEGLIYGRKLAFQNRLG